MNPTRCMALFASLIAAAVLSCAPAFAAPAIYYLAFTTTTGVAPSSGSFTYDPDVPEFTSFDVFWSGTDFDFTGWANQPIAGGYDPLCPDRTALTTFKLLSGECSSGPVWDVFSESSPYGLSAAFFGIHGDNTARNPFILGTFPGFLAAGPDYTGGVSILQTDSTPEPGTAAIVLVGEIGLVGTKRLRLLFDNLSRIPARSPGLRKLHASAPRSSCRRGVPIAPAPR